MSEFDRMDQDCIDMVHNNPRRRGVIRDGMILVPQKDAERFCAWEARAAAPARARCRIPDRGGPEHPAGRAGGGGVSLYISSRGFFSIAPEDTPHDSVRYMAGLVEGVASEFTSENPKLAEVFLFELNKAIETYSKNWRDIYDQSGNQPGVV